MKAASLKLPLAPRIFAVAWLAVWLFAQTLCVHHCASLVLAKDNGGGCCAKKSPEASKKASDSSFFPCSALKTVKLEAKTDMAGIAAVIVTSFQPSFVLTLPEPVVDYSWANHARALPRADFVFRPEVSLGAAFRSLAPPVLA